MSGPTKNAEFAEMIVDIRHRRPELVPFASGVAPGDDRTSYLNASEVGGCARQQWYRRNVEPEEPGEMDDRPGIFDRGHAAEMWASAMLRGVADEGGGKLLYAGDDQHRLIDAGARIAGTPDGLLKMDGERAIEIKSYGSTVDRASSPSKANVAQLELCLELFHRQTRHRPKEGLLVYVAAEDYGHVHVWRVPRRPAIWLEAVGKARDILDGKRAIDVMPMPSALCGLCPWRHDCQAADQRYMPLAEKLPSISLATLDRAVAALVDARAKLAETQDFVSRAEHDLKILMDRLGLKKARRPHYSVALTSKPGETYLDEKALADMLGGLAPYRRPGDPVEEITITRL